MSTMAEMAQEYRMAAVKIKLKIKQLKIKQLKEEGAPPNEIQAYQVVLAQLRDTSRLLSGYYDVPRFSENAAVGWKAGKINDR